MPVNVGGGEEGVGATGGGGLVEGATWNGGETGGKGSALADRDGNGVLVTSGVTGIEAAGATCTGAAGCNGGLEGPGVVGTAGWGVGGAKVGCGAGVIGGCHAGVVDSVLAVGAGGKGSSTTCGGGGGAGAGSGGTAVAGIPVTGGAWIIGPGSGVGPRPNRRLRRGPPWVGSVGWGVERSNSPWRRPGSCGSAPSDMGVETRCCRRGRAHAQPSCSAGRTGGSVDHDHLSSGVSSDQHRRPTHRGRGHPGDASGQSTARWGSPGCARRVGHHGRGCADTGVGRGGEVCFRCGPKRCIVAELTEVQRRYRRLIGAFCGERR